MYKRLDGVLLRVQTPSFYQTERENQGWKHLAAMAGSPTLVCGWLEVALVLVLLERVGQNNTGLNVLRLKRSVKM